MKELKINLTLQILILIFISLSILVFTAKDTNAASVCCEKTVDNLYCQYADESQCAANSKRAAANCEFTSFCKLGCGFNLDDGKCYKNRPYALADANKESFGNDPSCNLPQCDVGCCILGTEASLATQTACKAAAKNYPDLEPIFKPDVKDELTCLNTARSQDKGACKISNDECKYTTRAECNLPTATDFKGTGFFNGIYCSNSELGTICTPSNPELGGEGKRKGCLGNEEDVYYFDSCGNPEGVAKDCDYTQGTICGEDKGEYKCLPLDCSIPENDFKPVNRWRPDGKIKNGESWCESDSGILGGGEDKSDIKNRVSFGRDIPGSRYYNRLCVNNKIFTEPCKDFRQERCVSGKVEVADGTKYHEAACRPNRYQDCNSCNDQTKYLNEEDRVNCCTNTDVRDCSWQEGNKKCVSNIPPGSKFWAGEGSDKCAVANSECEVVWRIGGLRNFIGKLTKDTNLAGFLSEAISAGAAEYPKIISGADCLKHSYIVGMNNFCRAQGDCGADFNIVGKSNLEGFSSTDKIEEFMERFKYKAPEGLNEEDLTNWLGSGIPGGSDQVMFWERGGLILTVYGGRALFNAIGGIWLGQVWKAGAWAGVKSTMSAAVLGYGRTDLAKLGMNYVTDEMLKENLLKKAIVKEALFKETKPELITKIGGKPVKDVTIKELKDAIGEEGVKEVASKLGSNLLTNIIYAANLYMTIASFASIADMVFSEKYTTKIQTTCNPWVAPVGSEDCSKCNPDDKNYVFEDSTGRKCTEYICKSLGQSCALINQGTGNETCVSQNPNDVNAPVISDWKDALGDYKAITLLNYGYRYDTQIPAFTKFPIAIKTDEPSQCKISFNHSVKYDEMQPYYFGGPLYEYNHYMILDFPTQEKLTAEGKIEVSSGGSYKLYVRCQDSLGNANERDYVIQFEIEKGPDLTPPSIEGTSIISGSYFTNKANEQSLTIYINEPADCKWSNLDKEYDSMENEFAVVADKNPNSLLLYERSTVLKPLIDDIENKFYFRCKDQPGSPEEKRNVMEKSYEFSLKGTVPLEIRSIEPSGDIFTNNVTLKVETYGGAYKDGTARCGYNDKSSDYNGMIEFAETNESIHRQTLLLDPGSYIYYIYCVDGGGNIAVNQTQFKIAVDMEAPKIIRIYEDTSYTPSHLKIVLNEASICEYAFGDFEFGKGNKMPEDNSKEHDALFNDNSKYYIRCKDLYNNYMPLTIVYT
ncbi:MAG: hypothetical protein AB1571_03810 [Nanoarchaeota archaeon]